MDSQYVVNVEGAIWRDGKYLMLVRGAEETHAAGTLSFVGGKVDEQSAATDVLETSLKREITEETTVVGGDLTYVHSTHFLASDGDKVIDIVFLCRYLSGVPTISDVGEVAELSWLTADEILVHPRTPEWTSRTLTHVETVRTQLGW